jgi:hypothetical protein
MIELVVMYHCGMTGRETCWVPTPYKSLARKGQFIMMTLRLYTGGKVPHLLRSSTPYHLRTSRRHVSTMPRPYRFHVCANWQSAPPGYAPKKRSVPFAPGTAIGSWRDLVLTWPRHGFSKTPGEDFFYVQEVRAPEIRPCSTSSDTYSDAKPVGR